MTTLEEKDHKRVHTDSGIEQEFFMIDRSYYMKRPDLQIAGRALLGATPPKGQEVCTNTHTHIHTSACD
jgi:glutamine synthetase type III